MTMLKVLTVLFFAQGVFAKGEIRVNSYVRILSEQKLTLDKLVGSEENDQKLMSELRKVELSSTPKLGERIVFSNRALSIFFRKNLSIEALKKYKLIIPSQVIVENKGLVFDSTEVIQKLKDKWLPLCNGCELEIQNLSLPIISDNRQGKPWDLQVSRTLPKGNFSVRIDFMDGAQQIYWVTGQLLIYKKVPVAKRAIQFGERFSSKDIKIQLKEITFTRDSTPRLKDIVGQQSKQGMAAGQIIWQSSLVREKALSRGQLVRVRADADTFQVSLTAKAEQDGYVGDVVNVRNMHTKKLMSGVVTNKGEVAIKW